jgi:hypothetical protein
MGSAAVAKHQARYIGTLGVRDIHHLYLYGKPLKIYIYNHIGL